MSTVNSTLVSKIMLRNVKEVWLRNLTEMDIVGEDDNGHRLDLHGRRCHLLKLRSNR